MMSDAMVIVDGVSKKFCRSLKKSLWYGVRDTASELIGSSNGHSVLRKDEFWAVKGVSFQVNRGETVGLIGHNGAGKTTLLRMINGLIKPDTGRIEIRGRVQALIALGAGFNPVLTGRENILINAAILGITKAEITRRFDDIVEFSGIREFIDMPVQSYSSGMAVRLGFSIAAHLEPEILLVDEVLAVGDLAFRTKSQVRIQELKNRGTAIILVSHNLHTISHICTRAITLEKGRILFDGETEQAIDTYRTSLIGQNEAIKETLRPGTGEIKIIGLDVLNYYNAEETEFEISDFIKFRLHYQAQHNVNNPVFNTTINILNGDQVTGLRTDTSGLLLGEIEGSGYIDIIIPNLNLLPNIYTIDAAIFHQDGFTYYDRMNKIGHFRVKGGSLINGTAYLPHQWDHHGVNS